MLAGVGYLVDIVGQLHRLLGTRPFVAGIDRLVIKLGTMFVGYAGSARGVELSGVMADVGPYYY